MASDWESLITKEKSVKQLVTGAVIHRLTGRKDVVTILNKFNNSVSYDDVLKQNEAWSRMVQQSDCWANTMVKGIATHVTLDNNDGRQETNTGAGATHDTNFTIFRPVLKEEIHQRNEITREKLHLGQDFDEVTEVPDYLIGQGKSPPLFPSHVDNTDTSELEISLKKDLIWAITIGYDGYDLGDPIGSWTDFKKKTTDPIYQNLYLNTYQPFLSLQSTLCARSF